MSIEIRELVIRSEVLERNAGHPTPGGSNEASHAALQRLKAEMLAACREWLRDQLQNRQER